MSNVGYLTADKTSESDNQYTPAYGVKPILKYIESFIEAAYDWRHPNLHEYFKKNFTIWCPFDDESSEFVKILSKKYKVIYSNAEAGQNFFEYEPKEHYDIIMSNPPFSKKDAILKRLYELGKPYAMIMPLSVLQGQKRFKYIRDCQALIFDKRMNFYKDKEHTKMQTGVSFASIYFCRDFLPQDLIFEELDNEV